VKASVFFGGTIDLLRHNGVRNCAAGHWPQFQKPTAFEQLTVFGKPDGTENEQGRGKLNVLQARPVSDRLAEIQTIHLAGSAPLLGGNSATDKKSSGYRHAADAGPQAAVA
jgi:urea transport system ATP-binding protein